ncbi:hypothetical protein X767_13110 [Mesorhizobium sp. LSJC264A00]|nr:hypothetical protein X767_13110 [Mesorhizobium sp. LSJC264A00]
MREEVTLLAARRFPDKLDHAKRYRSPDSVVIIQVVDDPTMEIVAWPFCSNGWVVN